MTRLRTSRPSSSVPKRCALDGDCDGGKIWASGSCGAMYGAKIATITHPTAMTAPTTASGCRHAGLMRPRLLARLAERDRAHRTLILGSMTP